MKPEAASLYVDAAVNAYLTRELQPREIGPDGLRAFMKKVLPYYEDSRVSRLICDELDAVERGDTPKLILTMPPQEGKTTHASEALPAYWIGRHRRTSVIMSSYNDDRAQVNSRHVRDILESPDWPYADVRLRPDTRNVGHMEMTDGSALHAVGVGGGMTGYGADLLLIDDYVKDSEDANSAALRDRAWDWYQRVALTRRHTDTREIIVATRWHEDDLIGRVLADPIEAATWRVVEIAAFAHEDDPLGREVGEYLHGRNPQEYAESRRRMDPQGFEALYQQRPTSPEGNMFKRGWWKSYDPDVTPVEARFITVDSAFKQTVASDYSAAAIWGKAGERAYCLGAWNERVEFPELLDRLAMLYETFRVPLVIEDAGSGQSAIQVLQRWGIPIIRKRLPRYSSKAERAEQVTPWIRAGQVYLADDEHWWSFGNTVTRFSFIEQHASFRPNASTHDDLVDTTSIALSELFAHAPLKGTDPGSRWATYRVGNAAVSSPERSVGADLFGAR